MSNPDAGGRGMNYTLNFHCVDTGLQSQLIFKGAIGQVPLIPRIGEFVNALEDKAKPNNIQTREVSFVEYIYKKDSILVEITLKRG
jgi:hypothetical protein